MAVAVKDRATAEKVMTLRTQARAIMDEIADVSKPMTREEMNTKQEAAAALITRADIIAGYTPDNEIDDQGGLGEDGRAGAIIDERNTRGAPGAGSRDGKPEKRVQRLAAHEQRMAELRDSIEEQFGGPNSLILALGRRSLNIEQFSTRQQQVVNELRDLTKRTITAETGGDSGAEYLLPLQQESSIFMQPMEVQGMMQYARRFTVRGRAIRIPYLVQTDATGSNRPMGGIADVTIVGEGESKPEFEPKFAQRLLTVYKYAGYTEIADETLADDMSGDLAPTVQNVIGGQITNKVNEDVTIDGTGTAMPLGAFHDNNPGLYKQTRQTANTITVRDIFNMYAHHILGPASAWFMHPSALVKLYEMALSGNTLVTFLPGLTGKPGMQLLGLPIVLTPFMNTIGLQGDIALGNGAFYALAVRQALTIESSTHYRFRNDVTSYRFFMRAGGIPIPDGTYSYKAVSSVKQWELSPFVVLDNVVTS